MVKRIFIAAAAWSCSACTVVEIHGASRATIVGLGVLRIESDPAAKALAYRVRGVGLVPTVNGITLGYAAQDAVLLTDPHDCRVVIFEQPDPRIMNLIGNADDICFYQGGNQP